MALHSLYCADVPWRNCSLTHAWYQRVTDGQTVRRSDRIANTALCMASYADRWRAVIIFTVWRRRYRYYKARYTCFSNSAVSAPSSICFDYNVCGVMELLINFYRTSNPAVDEKEPIVRRCLEYSRAPCWRWLLQTWTFLRFAYSQYVVNAFGRWHQRLRFKRWGVWREGRCRGLKDVKSCSREALPIHLIRHLCCRMYRLATIHFVTNS